MGDKQDTEAGRSGEADMHGSASSSSNGDESSRKRERRTKAREEKEGLDGGIETQEMTATKKLRERKQTGEKSYKASGSEEAVKDVTQKRANPTPRVNRKRVQDTANTAQGEPERRPSVNLPRRLFANNQIPPKGRINAYSKPDYLRIIAEVLEGTLEFDVIRESYFGHLFALPTRHCSMSGKLVHQFLCRELLTRKKHELWFVFGGYPIKFSLREFALVTGLNCDPLPSVAEIKKMQKPADGDEYYWYELIGPKEGYTIVDLVNTLQRDARLPGAEQMGGGRRLCLALIVLVEGILTSSSSVPKPRKKLVQMVKDVDAFLKYPWGRVSFEHTLEMVKVGTKIASSDVLAEKLSKSYTTTHGFTLAIQLLILKAIPQLEYILPGGEENVTITSRAVGNLQTLRAYNTKNIREVEEDPNLEVNCILDDEDGVAEGDYSWEDEEEDVGIDFMNAELAARRCFRIKEWKAWADHLPLTTDMMVPSTRPTKVGQVEYKGCTEKGKAKAGTNLRKAKHKEKDEEQGVWVGYREGRHNHGGGTAQQ